MGEFKLVIADPKSGKCVQKVVSEQAGSPLIGKKIGDKIRGEAFDLTGYEFEITGGADYCGFPMRKDIEGPVRKKILLVSGVGLRNNEDGIRRRKTLCGNTIHSKISQVCLKVITKGKTPLGPEEEPKVEEKESKTEKKAEVKEKKAETKEPKEEKKAEVKTEKPKEEKKPKTAKKE